MAILNLYWFVLYAVPSTGEMGLQRGRRKKGFGWDGGTEGSRSNVLIRELLGNSPLLKHPGWGGQGRYPTEDQV